MYGMGLPISDQILAVDYWVALRVVPGVGDVSTTLFFWEFNRGGFRSIVWGGFVTNFIPSQSRLRSGRFRTGWQKDVMD
jgi:hypothetical protein